MARTPLLQTAEVRIIRGKNEHSNPTVWFGSNQYKKKPEHVRLVGECLMAWTVAETFFAVLLASLLRADTNTTIAVFSSLRRNTARHDAIKQAANHALDKEGNKIIWALLWYAKSLESQRNDLAHGFFGRVFQIEDGLAWMAQDKITLIQIDWNNLFTGKGAPGVGLRSEANIVENTFIYRLADLERIADEFDQLAVITNELRSCVQDLQGPTPVSLTSPSVARLKSFAPIQEGLEVLRRREELQSQQASSPTPPLPPSM